MKISEETIQTLDEAIQVHKAWKVRFNVAIVKQEKLDHEAIGRDNCCVLGQWLHAEGSGRYGAHSLFTRLMECHGDFHQEAARVARQINAGQNDMAIRALGATSSFTTASTNVISAIQDLKRSLLES